MRGERLKRLAAGILTVVTVFTLATPAYAARISGADPGRWKNTQTMADGIKMSKSDAYNWVIGELTRISAECTSALDSTAQPNVSKVLSLYGSYLAYMNWAVSNVSYASDEDQWTVFQGPGDFDTATAADLIDGAESLRNKINERGLLPSVTDMTNGTFNSTGATSSALSSSNTLLNSDSIYGYAGYYSAMKSIIRDYVDGHVLSIMMKHFGLTSSGSRSSMVSALSEDFPTEWWEQTQNGTPPAEMITVITELKSEIVPYLDVMNQIYSAHSTASYRILKSETLTSDGREYDVKGYSYDQENGLEFTQNASYVTQAAYYYLYSAQSGETQDNEVVLDNIDLSNGALAIMANAKLIGGEVVCDGTPELTTLGYYVLAAGATYDPFVSIAGNDTYMAVLDQFLATNDQKEKVIRVLQSAINTRKPLYVTDASRGSWSSSDTVTEIPAASYRVAFLRDFLSADKNVTSAYAVIKGQIKVSQVDSSTWEYVQGGSNASTNTGTTNNGDSTTTTTTTIDTSQTGAMVTVGTEELMASSTQMSMPVAYTCGSSSLITDGRAKDNAVDTIGGLTSIIVHNASVDMKSNTYLENADTEMLFLNGLGDIVLSDGTVVLPAIANPILYEYDSEVTDEVEPTTKAYYPYTAAFLNHYPSARVSVDKKAYLSGTSDVGKYIIMLATDGALEGVYIYGTGTGDQMKTRITDRIRVAGINGNSLSTSQDLTAVTEACQYAEAETGNWRQWFGTGMSGISNPDYLVYLPQANSDGIPLFPIVEDNVDMRDSYIALAGPIVTSAVRYISTADSTADSVRTSSGVFRIESFIYDFMGQGMLGNAYSETMIKNYQLSYDMLVEQQYGRFTELIKDFTSDALENLGRIDGVLAIKNGYENGFFNTIMDFVQRGYLIIAVILLILIAVKFLRGRYNLISVFLIAALVFSAFEVYAVWMPTAIPAAYNFFVNDVVEDVVWNTVTVKSESYEEVYKDAGRKDPQTGELRPYTATITLYRLTQGEMEQIAERANVSEVDIRSGRTVFLDEQAGIFVQGDAIKMSIDKLLANNTMRGLYKSQWELIESGAEEVEPIDVQGNGNPYIIKLTNPYVSLESYYTPFCQIERSFLVNLNNFANIFRVDRQVYRYSDYVYKDAFLFNAFTNSAIFTDPDNTSYDTLKLNIRDNTILGGNTATVDDIIALCEQHLSPFSDWLNLRGMFANPSQAMRDSLWGQMLQKQGYYSEDWTMTPEQEEKVTDLINYINDQTKQFVIRNSDQLNFCSDENAIKLVSLYATTCFTHRVSQFGSWLYPNYINAADIELTDVLYGSMTTLKDRNTAADGDIVNTVTLNLGAWGAILVLLITLFSAVFVFILTYLVPILYAMFGVILVYKLLNDEQSIGLVKGYIKVTGVTVVLYMVYSFGLKLVSSMGYQWYGYLGTLLVTIGCLYFLLFVCMSVVTNPLELGNDTLARNLFGALDRLTGHRLSRLTSNSLHINSRNVYGGMQPVGVQSYMRGASVDDRWSSRRPRRGDHYGRWSDFDDYDMSTRARVINRFGQLHHAEEVGTTRTGFRQTRFMRGFRNVSSRFTGSNNQSSTNSSDGDRFENYTHRGT